MYNIYIYISVVVNMIQFAYARSTFSFLKHKLPYDAGLSTVFHESYPEILDTLTVSSSSSSGGTSHCDMIFLRVFVICIAFLPQFQW